MRLFEPIVWRDRIMLPADKELTDSDVAALRRRFPDLIIRIRDPILDEIVEFEDDSHDRRMADSVKNRIVETMSDVGEQVSKQASMKRVNFRAIHAAVGEIMKDLSSNPVHAALLARTIGGEGYLAEHTGRVFYLSMVLGSAARAYVADERQRQSNARDLRSSVTMDLTPLGLGAMFMDLGMYPLQDLFKANRPPTDDEWLAIRKHPIEGAGMLPESFSPAAKTVVKSHHENVAGTGYPAGLEADKIHVLARIVRITDAFEAATADRVYKQAKSPARALWEMLVGPYP